MRAKPKEEPEKALGRLQAMRTHFHRPRTSEADDLRERVHETRNWCRRNVHLARVESCLRPQFLAPTPLPASRWHAVTEVRCVRHGELAATDGLFHIPSVGRFLVYFPDVKVSNGVAQLVSEGFFDVHDAPPWGTWVSYFKESITDRERSGYLLAWIPEVLVPFANEGIEASEEQCIAWLEDTKTEIKEILEALAIKP